MNTTNYNNLRKLFPGSICLGLLVVIGMNACIAFPQTPLPFSFVSGLPKNEFLFVHVYDDDYTCVEGFCGCAVSESPASPFEFRDGNLRINQYFLEPVPTDWNSFRKSNNLITLYSDWSQRTTQLQTFSSFPFSTPVGSFSILGVNQQGDIQVLIDNEYVIIPVGMDYTYTSKQPEDVGEECKVLHKYRLHNYGFIKDATVEFAGDEGCCNPEGWSP